MSTTVVLKIKSDNAALVGECARDEVVRLLREAANRIANGSDGYIIRDINGNQVGDLDADIDEQNEEE